MMADKCRSDLGNNLATFLLLSINATQFNSMRLKDILGALMIELSWNMIITFTPPS